MISSLHIKGFRCFEEFDMADLGRVNLIVGKNNSGKTSVLEALYLLAMGPDGSAMQHLLNRRGENSTYEGRERGAFDMSHLFYGHVFEDGAVLGLKAPGVSGVRWIVFSGGHSPVEGQDLEGLALFIDADSLPKRLSIRLTPTGMLPVEALQALLKPKDALPCQLIHPEQSSVRGLVGAWEQISLTPGEDLVVEALRILEPRVDRIAPQNPRNGSSGPGFRVRLRGTPQPIPLGSMGDGMYHILAIALALLQSKGGVLLVDEIDTGLHHKAMTEMWKLVIRAAKEADVQVFATTHSRDCVESLADVLDAEPTADGVSLHRLEAGKPKAVSFTAKQIRLLAENWVELR
jgi:hypothetical protein